LSPTVFRARGYRFFFFSREESRKHVHVISADGEAKFWLEPALELAKQVGYSSKEIRQIEDLIKERKDEIVAAWRDHFAS
jgi:hypothetical protein